MEGEPRGLPLCPSLCRQWAEGLGGPGAESCLLHFLAVASLSFRGFICKWGHCFLPTRPIVLLIMVSGASPAGHLDTWQGSFPPVLTTDQRGWPQGRWGDRSTETSTR